jgi:hypothetical protein
MARVRKVSIRDLYPLVRYRQVTVRIKRRHRTVPHVPPPDGEYEASLDFSDARNSQFLVLLFGGI